MICLHVHEFQYDQARHHVNLQFLCPKRAEDIVIYIKAVNNCKAPLFAFGVSYKYVASHAATEPLKMGYTPVRGVAL